jgi:benzylsuccinate CoA-transferase BbsF subunit
MSRKVFEGIKVAEFAWVVVGPTTSKYLADHGATVVKIESHTHLDTLKGTSPFPAGKTSLDGSMCYGRCNSNKYCVSIDLERPGGQELAWKLINWADIVTESFSPRVMKKLGLDYESVSRVRPDIIYLSSSMQGRGGPHSSYVGYGQNACALIGFAELSGWPDSAPVAPYGPFTDFICPRFNVVALLAALDYRRRTGRGQWIEQSQFETSLHFLSPVVMDCAVNGKIARRQGNRLDHAAPHGVFPCKGDDYWVAIAVFTDEDWEAFGKAIGSPEWVKSAEFSTLSRRKEHEDALEQRVAAWTSGHTAGEVESILQSAGVAANVVAKPSDVYEDPQLKHRNYFVRLDHPAMGSQAFEPQSCFILSKTPREINRPSPCIGEHNEYVFKELLGMSDDEIAEHIADGSITTELSGEFQVRM